MVFQSNVSLVSLLIILSSRPLVMASHPLEYSIRGDKKLIKSTTCNQLFYLGRGPTLLRKSTKTLMRAFLGTIIQLLQRFSINSAWSSSFTRVRTYANVRVSVWTWLHLKHKKRSKKWYSIRETHRKSDWFQKIHI